MDRGEVEQNLRTKDTFNRTSQPFYRFHCIALVFQQAVYILNQLIVLTLQLQAYIASDVYKSTGRAGVL